MKETEDQKTLVQRARDFVFGRQRAYLQTFDLKNPENVAVLSDLAKFCRAHETTFHVDPRAHALAEGRREVWLRIQNHLRMDSESLWKIIERRGS
jgi:hypothetical protein